MTTATPGVAGARTSGVLTANRASQAPGWFGHGRGSTVSPAERKERHARAQRSEEVRGKDLRTRRSRRRESAAAKWPEATEALSGWQPPLPTSVASSRRAVTLTNERRRTVPYSVSRINGDPRFPEGQLAVSEVSPSARHGRWDNEERRRVHLPTHSVASSSQRPDPSRARLVPAAACTTKRRSPNEEDKRDVRKRCSSAAEGARPLGVLTRRRSERTSSQGGSA